MREIKFRAYDKVKKEWLLGYEYPNLGGFSMFGEMMMMGEYASLLSEYFPDRLNDIELMQFTGLLDSVGKEIYEGDILTNDLENDVVDWDDSAGCWSVRNGVPPLDRVHYWYDSAKVIGNIFMNPELLTNESK